MARIPDRRGTVTGFDDRSGLGTLVDTVDRREYPFHCTAITDGSRTIETGRAVSFRIVAGPAGRWEAGMITDRCDH